MVQGGRGENMPKFVSPTRGSLSFDGVFAELEAYLAEDPESRYTLIVGTDSQLKTQETVFVSAIVMHREGKGGRYFYQKRLERRMQSIRQRILFETSLSLDLAARLANRLANSGYHDLDVQIHSDIGQDGPTKELIREIVGMVTGSGFDARIKPDSFGASSVADRYTK